MSGPRKGGTGPWVTRPRPLASPTLRLYCFPYAGAGASAFREWSVELADRAGVEVAPIQLPGRETRLREPPLIEVEPLAKELLADLDGRYAIFGHSMGARLAFEVCRWLRSAGADPPSAFVAAGCPAPQLPLPDERDSDLPDADFVARITGMGGTPAEIFGDPELRDLLLPTIRSDFAWVDNYVYRHEPPLDCPILALAGEDDPVARPEQVAHWGEQTTARYAFHMLPGDHFFIQTARSRALDLITDWVVAG